MTVHTTIAIGQLEAVVIPDVLTGAVLPDEDGEHRLELLVDGVHCANCIRKIESRLSQDPAITGARVNLTLRRLSVSWRGQPDHAETIGTVVRNLGYPVAPYDAGSLSAAHEGTGRELLRSLAIAGFASANVMMLAWAVWAGQAQGMAQGTQAFFNWLSALVAVPALAIAGRPFFRSALGALRARRTNIDVPIVAALVLATAISMMELMRQGAHVYFDSATMLLFVLLIGRYLDFRVRAKSREAIERLAMMRPDHATIITADGSTSTVAAALVEPGMMVVVSPGDALPVDGIVEKGVASLDRAAVTGETLPEIVRPGDEVLAGCVNGTEPLVIRATKPAADSHLSQILRLVEQAQLHKGSAATLADRLSAIWTPLVHAVALVTLLGWWIVADAELPAALLHAVTVLIIACPCAIGIAIPAVQVAAIGGLLRRGVLVRSGGALERLAGIDRVVFDKTGTLTSGRPELIEAPRDGQVREVAASLARGSRHPFSRAISARYGDGQPVEDRIETVGGGITGIVDGTRAWMGSAAFCGIEQPSADAQSEVWVRQAPVPPSRFVFADPVRPDASETLVYFREVGIGIAILSGDRQGAVANCAEELGISEYRGELKPDMKAKLLSRGLVGTRPLMIGDGLNDAPALSAAHVSASFGHGVPATQVAADFVLPAGQLSSITTAYATARKAARIVRQNLAFAALYNLLLIPIAVFGHASPLIAAAAMSASSVIVTLNALRARPPRQRTSR